MTSSMNSKSLRIFSVSIVACSGEERGVGRKRKEERERDGGHPPPLPWQIANSAPMISVPLPHLLLHGLVTTLHSCFLI